MFEFLKALRRDKSSAAYRAALADSEAARAAAISSLDTFRQRLPAVLIDGAPEDAKAMEEKIQELQREIEQLQSVIVELGPRLAEAAKREEQAELDRLYEAAVKARAEGVVCLDHYDAAALKVKDALQGLTAANDLIRRFHRRAKELKDDRRITLPEQQRAIDAGRPGLPYAMETATILPSSSGGPPIWKAFVN